MAGTGEKGIPGCGWSEVGCCAAGGGASAAWVPGWSAPPSSSSCTVGSPWGRTGRDGCCGMALTGIVELEACWSVWVCWYGSLALSALCQRPGRGCCGAGCCAVASVVVGASGWFAGCTGCPCLWASGANTKWSSVYVIANGGTLFALVYGLTIGWSLTAWCSLWSRCRTVGRELGGGGDYWMRLKACS